MAQYIIYSIKHKIVTIVYTYMPQIYKRAVLFNVVKFPSKRKF